ncbi:hypothetical protein Tco_0282963 [Tanacetum coccineum]
MDKLLDTPDKHETYENEEGNPLSAGKSSEVSTELFQKAHLYVERELAIDKESVSETIRWISYGLRAIVVKYDAYNINGYTFRTKCHDGKVYQNSGVSVEAIVASYLYRSCNHKTAYYYGVLQGLCYDVLRNGYTSYTDRVKLNTDIGNTSEEIDYDSLEPPKSLLKWYHYLSDEYKDNGRFWGSKSGCNESDVKPSWKDIEKAKTCMLAKAQAFEASSKAKVEACGSKAKLQASTKTLIVKSPVPITNCVLWLANAKTRDAIKGKTFGVKIQ